MVESRIRILRMSLDQTVRRNLRPSALSAVSPCDGAMAQECDGLCDDLRVLGDLCVSIIRAFEGRESMRRRPQGYRRTKYHLVSLCLCGSTRQKTVVSEATRLHHLVGHDGFDPPTVADP